MELATLHLDTNKVFKLLQEKGYTEEEAEGFIAAVQEITLPGVATKHDIQSLKDEFQDLKDEFQDLKLATKQDIQNLKQEIQDIKLDIEALRAGLKQDSHELKAIVQKDIANIKVWFLGAMLTQTIALVALILSI